MSPHAYRDQHSTGTETTTAARPAAAGQPGYDITRNASPEAVEGARRLARQAMCAWGLNAQAETAALLISELATNAIRHTRSRTLRVIVARPTPALVRLSVVDTEPRHLPEICSANDEEESGRGLRLVAAFADRWGYDLLRSRPRRGPWGKCCWAELKAGAER